MLLYRFHFLPFLWRKYGLVYYRDLNDELGREDIFRPTVGNNYSELALIMELEP
jgi:hypothetical protein